MSGLKGLINGAILRALIVFILSLVLTIMIVGALVKYGNDNKEERNKYEECYKEEISDSELKEIELSTAL